MAIFRVERTRDYTVMCNCHLRDQNLSLKAKGLLSIMLSLPDDWNYTTKGLAAICKEGTEAIGTGLKELEKAGYIVRRLIRGEHGRITDTEYTIYEQPQKEASPEPDMGKLEPASLNTEGPGTASPHPGNPDTVVPDTGAPGTENRPEINIDIQRKDQVITDRPIPSFLHHTSVAEGRTEISEKRREIMDQIDYDLIADSANREQLDEFVEIMLEVALCRSPTIRIGREAEYPTALVQERFEKITFSHIEKVLAGIRENTTRVWNTRAYLLAALFNAPSSTDNHYTMLVNHDFHHGG